MTNLKKLRLILVLLITSSITSTSWSQWSQYGQSINGTVAGDSLGTSVAINGDGTIMAVGGASNNGGGNDAGYVQVYELISNVWTQMGSNINGENAGDLSGTSVSLSDDGLTLAIGSPKNNGGVYLGGSVRVYEYISNNWSQIGSDIDGTIYGGRLGLSISLDSSGATVVISNSFANGGTGGAGDVKVYKNISGTWTQFGNTITGTISNSQFGNSVDISDDGLTIVIGAFQSAVSLAGIPQNGVGTISVYEYSPFNGLWTQKGNIINGEAANDKFGFSVSISGDGQTIAGGAPFNDNSFSNGGNVRIFEYLTGNWATVGSAINGSIVFGRCGNSVSLNADGTTIAIGAFRFSPNYSTLSNAGHIRVFNLVSSNWSQVDLDINGVETLESFGHSTSINNDGTIIAGGAFKNTSAGVNAGQVRAYKLCSSTYSSIVSVNCGNYISPSGQLWDTTGIYIDTLIGGNSIGCDSIITVDLTINQASSSAITEVSCDEYTSPSGQLLTVTGVYNDTLFNANSNGCDSVIVIDLTINQTTSSTISEVVCDEYISPSGQLLTITGIYNDTLFNANSIGCDSVVIIDLTVNESTQSFFNEIVCIEYISPSGQVWNTTGIYNDTLFGGNSQGCDSIITIDLIIKTVNIDVNVNGTVMTSMAGSSTYQWLDCNNGYSIIDFATNQIYNPVNIGEYAVEVTENGCTDTSLCINIVGLNINENEIFDSKINIFPNPIQDYFTVSFEDHSALKISVYNTIGELIMIKESNKQITFFDASNLSKGIYLVHLTDGESLVIKKLIKE